MANPGWVDGSLWKLAYISVNYVSIMTLMDVRILDRFKLSLKSIQLESWFPSNRCVS